MTGIKPKACFFAFLFPPAVSKSLQPVAARTKLVPGMNCADIREPNQHPVRNDDHRGRISLRDASTVAAGKAGG